MALPQNWSKLHASLREYRTYPENLVQKPSGSYFHNVDTYCLKRQHTGYQTNLQLYRLLLDRVDETLFKPEDDTSLPFKVGFRDFGLHRKLAHNSFKPYDTDLRKGDDFEALSDDAVMNHLGASAFHRDLQINKLGKDPDSRFM
jgi:hypothetical protein